MKNGNPKSKVVRAMLRKSDDHPVFWMVGGVVESNLVQSTTSFTKPVHSIKVGMFPQEARRDVSVWGKIFGFTLKVAPVDDDGFISFLTRTDTRPNEGKALVIKLCSCF